VNLGRPIVTNGDIFCSCERATLPKLLWGRLVVFMQGFEYVLRHQLVDDTAEELAKFLHSNRQLDPQKKREFLATRLAAFCFICN